MNAKTVAAAIAGAVALGLGGAGVVDPPVFIGTPTGGVVVSTSSGGGGGMANVFMQPASASGSDSGGACKRYSSAVTWATASADGHGCATLGKACSLMSGGDTTELESGYYAHYGLGSPWPSLTKSDCDPSVQTTFKCATQYACTFGLLWIGDIGSSSTDLAPNHVTFDGFDVAQFRLFGANGAGISNHDTLQNSHIHWWEAGSGQTCCQGDHGVGDYFSLINNEIGPVCCNADAIDIWSNYCSCTATDGSHSQSPVGTLITGNYIHDIYNTCRTSSTNDQAQIKASLVSDCTFEADSVGAGDCTGPDCTGHCTASCLTEAQVVALIGTCCYHIDALQMEGCISCTISYNTVYDAGEQGFWLEDTSGTPYTDFNVIGNAISACPICGIRTLHFGDLYNGTFGGTINFLYNTVNGTLSFGNAGTHATNGTGEYAAGAVLNIVGNISPNMSMTNGADGGEGCTLGHANGSTLTPNFSHNLFADKLCGGSDTEASATFVSTDTINPNLTLSGAQTSINGGESVFCGAPGSGKAVTTSAFGGTGGAGTGQNRLLGAACDIGAVESG